MLQVSVLSPRSQRQEPSPAVPSSPRHRLRPRFVNIPAEIIPTTTGNPNPKQKPIRNLLLCTKAPDTTAAIESVANRLLCPADDRTPTRIIVLSNGALAVSECIKVVLKQRLQQQQQDDPKKKHLSMPRLVLASTTHGAYRESSLVDEETLSVVHAGVGQTFVEEQPGLAGLLDHAGLSAFRSRLKTPPSTCGKNLPPTASLIL